MESDKNKPTLTIDPEFQSKIPPLTDEEYKQLEENILKDGEVFEPLTVWNGVIVDGHNRYKIVQAHPEIKWSIREMDFPDKWAAFDWMYKNQLGRRNLTEEQRTYLLGKLYEARKHTVGAPIGNKNADKQCGQNDHIEEGRTSERIAKEMGVGRKTVQRSEKFAQGVDAIREHSPETADAILRGQMPVKKKDVMEVARAREEQQARMIEAIKNREPLNPKPAVEKERAFVAGTKENKELNEQIRSGIAELFATGSETEYTVDMLLEALRMNAERFVRSIRSDLELHKDLLCDSVNRDQIMTAIHEYILDEIEKIREEIENEYE